MYASSPSVRHILYDGGKLTKDERVFLQEDQPNLCIFSHTHQPQAEWFGKTLLFNPGSAGPRRFSLPRSVGLLTITQGKIMLKLIRLSDRVSTPKVENIQGRSKQKGGV